MKSEEIREGDIVEIDYIEEYTKEHINEGKALVIWKGFNHQPLVRKLNTKVTIWTCYEHIAKVVDHIDLEGYMDKNLSAEPCEDAISRQAVLSEIPVLWNSNGDKDYCMESLRDFVAELSPVTPQPKMQEVEE